MPFHLVFRVLGPLGVERDGVPLPVRGSKLPGLLAFLLFRIDQVVSPETLIDALWGDSPPPTARTALQMHVSKLRKLLDGDASVRLETTEGGYVLHLGPDRLDLDLFRKLVAEARSETAAGEHWAARESLERALALYRGAPLANVRIPGLPEPELAEIQELHLTAVADRLEADLALGRHLEVVPELEGLRTGHPLHERIVALAAVALYRSGRQAEALDSIAGLRHALSQELGIEPGPAIRRLEEQILAQDPALDSPVPADRVAPRTLRKTVAALVCRLFEHAASDDPETMSAELEQAMHQARAIVETHGGWVHESVLGKISAVFGTPRVHEDDTVRAVRAASELCAWYAAGIGAGDEGTGPTLRVGISLGEVLVESSHGQERLLSVTPLEEADHLARSAKPGEVLMNDAAARLVRRSAGIEPAEILLLDADGSSFAAFRLVESPLLVPAGRRFASPLVGRENELAVLQQAFARASRERTASLVTLLGATGVGKTRLAVEFLDRLGQEATAFTGRCLSYGRDITLFPIAEMVRQAAGIGDGDQPARAREKVARVIGGIEDAAFIEEQIASVLGLSGKSPVPDEIFWAIRRYLEAAAGGRPLVLVFDDIHWAETTLLDLIEYLVVTARNIPLLVASLARPELAEDRPGWGGGRLNAANLSLAPLDHDESAQLVNNLLGPADIDPAVRERILEAAEGHPLFLEELVAILVEDGLLQWQQDRWVASPDFAEVPIPATIQALIGARLDRLGVAERLLLEDASVVGTEFTEQNLAGFTPDGERLAPLLDALETKDMISLERESPISGRTFRFRHHLIRDVAYRAMSKSARAEAHEAFGDLLESGAGGRLPELEEIIGYHFEAAHAYRSELGRSDSWSSSLAARAAARLRSAGARAFARDDMPAAAGLLGRALALLGEDDPTRCELTWQLAAALFEKGEPDRAEAVLEVGLEDARRAGNEIAEWRIRLQQTDIRFWRNPEATNTQEMERFAIDAVGALERLGDLPGVAAAHRLLGDALGRRGRVGESVEAYEIGQRIAREAGDEREAAQRATLGVAHGPLSVERCLEITERSLANARRPNPETMAGLGFLLAMAGRFEEARGPFDDAVARAEELGTEWRLASIHMHYGAAMLLADDADAAEAVLRPAVETLQRMGEQSMFSTAVALLAEALYRKGELDEAMRTSIESEEATAEDDVASQMAWRGVRAKVLAARGELEEAERVAAEGTAFADRSDLLNMAGDAHLDLGIVLVAAGRADQATGEFETAAELYRRKGNLASLARAEATRSSLHLGAGR